MFLYSKILESPMLDLGFKLAKKKRYIPTVLSISETQKVLEQLEGTQRLIVELMYGSGLRVSECLRLRVQDFDFAKSCLTIHDGKGGKDRVTLLSRRLQKEIEAQIDTCLLYTSPSPRDLSTSRMPSSA